MVTKKIEVFNSKGKCEFVVKHRPEEHDSKEILEKLRSAITAKFHINLFTLLDIHHSKVTEENISSVDKVYFVQEKDKAKLITEGEFDANPTTELRTIEGKLQHT